MRFRTFMMRILFMILAVFTLSNLASAQKSGYVWANNPSSASYTPSAPFSFNSTGGAINITRSGVGTYAVRFNGLGGGAVSGGNVLVTSYGSGSGTCKVASWSSSGADFTANVRCFNSTGTAADSMFTVRVVWNNPAPAFKKNGYAWADNASGASYTPNATFSFNSTGGAINITRSGVGTYAVRFNGLGGGAVSGGNVQVTAYGSGSETCKVVSWSSTGADFTANVRCFNSAGGNADTRYSINIVW